VQHQHSTIYRPPGGGSLMGYNLVNEILNYAPKDLTPKEMVAALAFAADANDKTRLTWNSIEDPMFLRQLRVGRARLYELLESLVKKGVLVLASAGHRHGCAKYRFANLDPLQCPETLDTESGSSVRDSRTSSVQGTRTLKHDQCPEDPDVSVRDSRTPTNQDQSVSTTTNQDPNHPPLAAAARKAPPAAAASSERESERQQAGDQPRGQQRQLDAEDVSRAYAAARMEIGMPAAGSERVLIRAAAVALIREGQSAEYLVRLAAWIGAEHPGWIDLARARTAPGAPALIPSQRTARNEHCRDGECDSHNHPPCERGWITLPSGLAHCPCSPMSKPRSAPGGHETYRDADPSTFRPPAGHKSYRNQDDPGSFDEPL
jgi:hypothetical protein